MVGYFNMILLQIYHWVCHWKNFENRLTFGEVMGKSLVSCFLLTHGVVSALLRGNWQDFNWHDASRGPSAIAELLVFINCHEYMQLVLVKGVLLLRHSSKSSILIQQSKDLVMTSRAMPQQLQYEVKTPRLPSQFSNNMLRINVNITVNWEQC